MGPPAARQLKDSQSPGPRPSQFHLALALAIAKTKPDGISIRDYLAKIRHHILTGSRAANYGSANEYLDAAAYWYDSFKEGQLEIHELQVRIAKLEREKDRLKTANESYEVVGPPQPRDVQTAMEKASIPPGFTDVAAPKRGKKRKQDETKSARPIKKVAGKTEQSAPAFVPNDLIDDLAVFDVSGAGSATVLHLYRAHKLYQTIGTNPQDLAFHLTQAATNLVDHVFAIALQTQRHILDASATQDKRLRAQLVSIATSKIDTEFARILRAAGRAFMSLFHGLTTIWEKGTDAAKRHHGAVTYQYIKAFDTLLDAISSNCTLVAQLNAQQIVGETPTLPATKKADEKKVQKTKPAIKARIAQEIVLLLLALLTHLTPARQGPHTALFEGLLYLLLERTGQHLYLLIFGRERGATLEGEIIDDLPPNAAQIGILERQAIGIEVKFLVQLLERAMSIAPCVLGSLSGADCSTKSARGVTSKVKPTGLPKGMAALSLSAKEKLQRTLVACMFGSSRLGRKNHSIKTNSVGSQEGTVANDETSDEDAIETNNDFIEVLRKPVFTGPIPQLPKVDEADVPDWFMENVWRLVGWDILGWDQDF
ncbi:hypothetical protein FKW77_008729 [Venturia effusa]|uniref:Uncharacterized protein n=1 Tax=Venturia effusa TaxID=50376 RepID=A0A517LKR5_9PEZI|nr:hypothetical protein FKW77_008729 [Venturia effusa]